MDVHGLRTYAAYLADKLKGKRLGRFVQLDVHLFTCKVDSKQSLVFALANDDPHIYLGPSTLDGTALSSTFSSLLRKNYGNALVTDVRVLNDDRILCFDMTSINEVFKPVKTAFIIELIPTRPNFILMEEDKILYALKMTTLDHPHPIVKGLSYLPPEHKSVSSTPQDFDIDAYLKSCLEKEESLALRLRKRRYIALFQKAKNLKKSAIRRLNLVEEDLTKAEAHLQDAQIGTMLLTYANEIDCSFSPVVIDGLEIEVDTTRNAARNAELYFKRYKKAKNTIAMGEANLKRIEEEIEEAESLEFALAYGDDELLNQYLVALQKKHRLDTTPISYVPYLTEYKGVRVYLGKNANQNDFLTFHFGKSKEFYWFHVKDKTGSHVLCESENPSNELLQFCCELALLGTKLTSGEVQYCKRKALRKGKAKGQVILGAYQSTYIRNISPETKKAFEGLVRAKLKD